MRCVAVRVELGSPVSVGLVLYRSPSCPALPPASLRQRKLRELVDERGSGTGGTCGSDAFDGGREGSSGRRKLPTGAA